MDVALEWLQELFPAMGYGAAQAYVLFLIVAIITIINFRGQKRWVHY